MDVVLPEIHDPQARGGEVWSRRSLTRVKELLPEVTGQHAAVDAADRDSVDGAGPEVLALEDFGDCAGLVGALDVTAAQDERLLRRNRSVVFDCRLRRIAHDLLLG